MGFLSTFRKVRCTVVEEESTTWFKKRDSAGAFAFTQTAYLFKLMIPTTNVLPGWRHSELSSAHTDWCSEFKHSCSDSNSVLLYSNCLCKVWFETEVEKTVGLLAYIFYSLWGMTLCTGVMLFQTAKLYALPLTSVADYQNRYIPF